MALSAQLLLHVAAGGLALTSAPVALMAKKGARLHRASGLVFLGAMVAMTLTGAVMAFAGADRTTGWAAIFTFYLVASAFASAQAQLASARLLYAGFGLAILTVTGGFLWASILDPAPALGRIVPLVFAAVTLFALVSDIRLAIWPRMSGPQRLARHLWRMLAAALIAYMSFFIGQQQVFPESVRGWALWYAPPLFCFVALTYWMIKVRVASNGLGPRRKKAV